MNYLLTYWAILVSVVTACSAAAVYVIKNWRDVELLKKQQREQEEQLATLLDQLHNNQNRYVERELNYKRAADFRLQEQRTEMAREMAAIRQEAANAMLRLNERIETLDKRLSVSVERQSQLLDLTRRQEARSERVEKIVWSRMNAGSREE